MFESSSLIEQTCSSFFESSGLSYFQYYRIYDDGSVFALLNNTKTLKRFIELDFPSFSSFKESDKQRDSYWFMWDEELPWLPVQIARDNGVFHGMTYVRRAKNHFDMIGVAMSEERSNAASYYMSNMGRLKNFITYFEQEKGEIIDDARQNRLILPQNNRDANYKELCLGGNMRFDIDTPNGRTYITPQELSSVRLKLQGLSYKETGRIMEISPRSVETYLERIKLRTGITNLREVAFRLHQY
jgi:DNA-binding CsgD family transcriptional regulator